jgi:phenylpropionate dioxygenase-like ring-hydroxylating dioxygenase large terminal subunit
MVDDSGAQALPTWAYANEELLELEYPHFFLASWQFLGHENELQKPGDFVTLDLWRDSILVMRGRDGALRAFLNICRHRASRLLDGRGNCGARIQCRYHGWTYNNDGRLSGIPSPESFPDVDRSELGLLEINCQVYRGLVFARIAGEGPPIASRLGEADRWIAEYKPEDLVLQAEPVIEVWDANWKIAWDNYLENYHLPIGHPCLHRLLVESEVSADLPGGGSAGFFEMNPKPSSVEQERRYQELIECTDHRYTECVRRKWLQVDFESNMGIEFYPSLFSVFQVLPVAAGKTVIRMSLYAPPDLDPDEKELQAIDLAILDEVNQQDKVLCERIQRGVKTHGYRPGPLSLEESSIQAFHDRVRESLPVTRQAQAPPRGQLVNYNQRAQRSSEE